MLYLPVVNSMATSTHPWHVRDESLVSHYNFHVLLRKRVRRRKRVSIPCVSFVGDSYASSIDWLWLLNFKFCSFHHLLGRKTSSMVSNNSKFHLFLFHVSLIFDVFLLFGMVWYPTCKMFLIFLSNLEEW